MAPPGGYRWRVGHGLCRSCSRCCCNTVRYSRGWVLHARLGRCRTSARISRACSAPNRDVLLWRVRSLARNPEGEIYIGVTCAAAGTRGSAVATPVRNGGVRALAAPPADRGSRPGRCSPPSLSARSGARGPSGQGHWSCPPRPRQTADGRLCCRRRSHVHVCGLADAVASPLDACVLRRGRDHELVLQPRARASSAREAVPVSRSGMRC